MNLSGKSTAYEGVRAPAFSANCMAAIGCHASRLEDWDDWGQGKAGCGIVWGPSLPPGFDHYWPMDPIGF